MQKSGILTAIPAFQPPIAAILRKNRQTALERFLDFARNDNQKYVTVFCSTAETSWFARRLTPKRNRLLSSHSLPRIVDTME